MSHPAYSAIANKYRHVAVIRTNAHKPSL